MKVGWQGALTPEFQFFFEQRSTNVGGIVKLAGSVVVEDLSENIRMSVEVVLVKHRVIVGQSFGKSRQAGGRNLLKRCLVRFMTHSADVEHCAIFSVHTKANAPVDRNNCAFNKP